MTQITEKVLKKEEDDQKALRIRKHLLKNSK
jgi:hypothetical protein